MPLLFEYLRQADGSLMYSVSLSSPATPELEDVELTVPFNQTAVPFCMGLGQPGGVRTPLTWRWWTGKIWVERNVREVRSSWPPSPPFAAKGYGNNMLWCGSSAHGMRIKLVGEGANWLGALHSIQERPV